MAAAVAPGSNTIGVESGLYFIQTQHRGECVYDSFQMILTFADGLRAINAVKAEQLFREDPVGLLTNSKPYIKSVGMFMFAMDEEEYTTFLDENQDKNYKRLVFFYSLVLRRYVLIKLQECGWDTQALEEKYGLDKGGIQTLCPGVVDFGRDTSLKREKSLNEEGSSYAAIHIMEATGITPNYSSGTLKTTGATKDHINAIAAALFSLPVLNTNFRWSLTFNGMKNLIGMAIFAGATDRSGAHENSILKYRGEYYYCDNEIGVAIKLDMGGIDTIQPDSISYGSNDRGYFFKINDTVVYEEKGKVGLPLFRSSHIVYVYAKSDPVFGEKDACSLIPPAKPAPALNDRKPSVRFIEATAVAGMRNLAFGALGAAGAAGAGRNDVPVLRGTRRAGRPFLPHFGPRGKSRKNRRNARK